jgi:hypothetical protein
VAPVPLRWLLPGAPRLLRVALVPAGPSRRLPPRTSRPPRLALARPRWLLSRAMTRLRVSVVPPGLPRGLRARAMRPPRVAPAPSGTCRRTPPRPSTPPTPRAPPTPPGPPHSRRQGTASATRALRRPRRIPLAPSGALSARPPARRRELTPRRVAPVPRSPRPRRRRRPARPRRWAQPREPGSSPVPRLRPHRLAGPVRSLVSPRAATGRRVAPRGRGPRSWGRVGLGIGCRGAGVRWWPQPWWPSSP